MLSFTTTWMDLEDTMLSEISLIDKDKYCMVSLTCGIKNKAIPSSEVKRRNWWLPEEGIGG